MDAERPTPDAPIVFVERVIEPYTGMTLLGVGGHAPGTAVVTVWYDEDAAVHIQPNITTGHYSTQLPIEPCRRLRVTYDDRTVFEADMAAVGERPPTPATEPVGLVDTLLGTARRGIQSVASGEVLSPRRWAARIDRMGEFGLKIRQKLHYKWFDRRFRPRDPYQGYIERTPTERFPPPKYRPTISLLMPVYNVRPEWFREAVESVQMQSYEHWELCIADDASTRADLLSELSHLPKDPRIKIVHKSANEHICHATNSAAELATGEFIGLLDHDDKLAADALSHIVAELQTHPDADLIYSDEDKLTATGERYDPQFKPDWSPDLLLSYNYVNHFTVLRRSLFEAVGRFRPGFEGSQDHDLLLRATERTDRIRHIPRILYHWRAHAESTAESAGQKPIVHTSGRRAVTEALARRGISATVDQPAFAHRLGLPILDLLGPDTGPRVGVIVYGPADAAGRTLRALKSTTSYKPVEYYLVLDGPNLADGLNRMAAARTEDLLVFLAAGIEPTSADWLSRLVVHGTLDGVGAAGGLHRSITGDIMSAGIILNLGDGTTPNDACRQLSADRISYYFYAEVTRTVSAVARGCLLTPRRVFEAVGGFDAERYPASLFEVEYAMRLAGQGLRSVHVGGAVLRVTTPRDGVDPLEIQRFKQAFGRPIDPYSNPHFAEHAAFTPSGDLSPLLEKRPRPPLRMVVAAHNLNTPEGAPRYLSEIVLGLRDRGAVEPSIWSPAGGAGESVYSSKSVQVNVTDQLWSKRFVDGRWTRREYELAVAELVRQLRSAGPDVVLANTLLTFPMIEAAARVGVPSVWVIHESYSPEVLDRLFPPFARWRLQQAFAAASRVVPASHDTAALFRHWDVRGNVRVLHNGLPTDDLRRFLRTVSRTDAAMSVGGTPGKTRIVSVGTVCERKGQHTLVEAAAILAERRRDFVVDVVGLRDGVPYAGYVRQLVARRNLSDVVRLIPETDRVWWHLRAADVFVCTSYMETFSRSILEAEAFGLPIVSTPCQGVGEQVSWNANALVFPAGDAAALANQLDRLLSNEILRTDMARRSQAVFDTHLSYDEMLDRYEAVIRRAGPSTTATRSFRRAA